LLGKFYRSKDQTNNIKVLKKTRSQAVARIADRTARQQTLIISDCCTPYLTMPSEFGQPALIYSISNIMTANSLFFQISLTHIVIKWS